MLFCSGMTSVYAAEGDLSGDGTQGTGSRQVSTAGTSGGNGQASSSAESPSDAVVNPVTPGTDPATPGTDPATPGTDPATPGTDPATPGTDPATPGTDPATPGTDPTNPGTDPINTTPIDAENSAADQTLTAVIYTDDSMATVADDETEITVAGSLPEGGYITAWPVSVTIDGMQVFAAYDITIRNSDGSAFQPDEATGEPVRVNIDTPRLDNVDEVSVYHIEPSGDDTALTSADPSFIDATSVTVNPTVEDSVPATVADTSVTATKVADSVAVEESAVQFDAESFSIYVVASSTQANSEATAYQMKAEEHVALHCNNSGYYTSWSVEQKISGSYDTPTDGGVALGSSGANCTATVSSSATVGTFYRVIYNYSLYQKVSHSSWDWVEYNEYFYIKVVVAPVSITDTISTNGCLNAVVKDASGTVIDDLTGYTFTWAKGGTVITDPDGLQGLLPNGGQSVNVALTNGGLATYTLTVSQNGTPVGTATYNVPYAMQL